MPLEPLELALVLPEPLPLVFTPLKPLVLAQVDLEQLLLVRKKSKGDGLTFSKTKKR
jgi:hypothetical protein